MIYTPQNLQKLLLGLFFSTTMVITKQDRHTGEQIEEMRVQFNGDAFVVTRIDGRSGAIIEICRIQLLEPEGEWAIPTEQGDFSVCNTN